MTAYYRIKCFLYCFCIILLLIPTFYGCAGKNDDVKKDPFFQKWEARAEASKNYMPVETSRKGRLPEKTLQADAAGKERAAKRRLPGKKISLKLQDTGVATIIRALARSVDLNVLVNDKVGGKTSINVKEARWDQLFNGILRSHGLTYAWEGDLIRVMTIEDMEKDLQRASHTRDMLLTEPLNTKIIPVNYADEKKLKENLEKFLSKSKKGTPIGSVLVDEHTRSLIIKAVNNDMEKIIRLVAELDRPISQVRIEANIVEANKDTSKNLGVQWGGLVKGEGDVNHFITAGANSAGALGGTLDTPVNPTSGIAVNFPATLDENAGMTIGYIAERAGDNVLAVQLSALEKDGKLNILSSPSITTLDNQVAIIESGTDVPYQTVSADGNISIKWKKAVLSLEVKPHVIDEKTLKLNIKTKKDELDFSRSVNGNPTIITKNAETGVILQDGQTTVIGGLNKELKSDSESGVPLLMDIPWLGYLFKGSSRQDTMEDVLIFITPHILEKRVVSRPAAEEIETVEKENTGLEESETTPKPHILGNVAVENKETLWKMIRTVFGVYTPTHKTSVLKVNPHIKDADIVDVGQIIYFPAIELPKSAGEKEWLWVKMDEKDNLDDAYRFLRSYPGDLPPARLIPYWNKSSGLKFAIVLKEYFLNQTAAEKKLESLPRENYKNARIVISWGPDAVFYADPFLSYGDVQANEVSQDR